MVRKRGKKRGGDQVGEDDIYRWLWPSRRLLAEKFFLFSFFFAFGPALNSIWSNAADFEP